MAGKSPQSIDITQLGVPQLRSLTQQLEQVTDNNDAHVEILFNYCTETF